MPSTNVIAIVISNINRILQREMLYLILLLVALKKSKKYMMHIIFLIISLSSHIENMARILTYQIIDLMILMYVLKML